jgi:hypothetical protein
MAAVFDPGKTFSLVIGSSSYTDAELPPLDGVLNNCFQMDHIFKTFLKLQSQQRLTLVDQTLTEIFDSIKNISRAGKYDLLIIYFSGHGIKSEDSKNYYMAVKHTKMDDLSFTAIPVARLSKEIGNSLNVILILDSCFSEKIFDEFNARQFFIMASSAKDEKAKYPLETEGSVFTEALIQVIKQGTLATDSYLTAEQIFEAVKAKLTIEGHGIPRSSGQNDTGKIPLFANKSKIEGALEQSLVEELLKSIVLEGNEDIAKEARDITVTASSNPTGKDIQHFILKKFPVFLSHPLRRLLFSDKIINKYSVPHYKKIVQFLGLCLLSDLAHHRKLSVLENPMDYLENPSHGNFRKLFKEFIEKGFKEIFIKELGQRMRTLNAAMDEIEAAAENDSGTEVHRKLVLFIKNLSFMVNYRFLSIRLISVRKRLLEPDEFVHSYSELKGVDIETYKGSIRFKNKYLNSSTILLFRGSPGNTVTSDDPYVNLWPLIIDINTFSLEHERPELYLLSGRNDRNSYKYAHALSGDLPDVVYNQIDGEFEDTHVQKSFEVYEHYFQK